MPHISTAVEYGLHCLLFLVGRDEDVAAPSARDLAELQGIPVGYAAKMFTKLQKAGLLHASEGVRGGLRLAREPATISVNDVVIAIDGDQRLFECREIRAKCALFDDDKPAWAVRGVCGIHALMRRAEESMRDVLRGVTLADLSSGFGTRASPEFKQDVLDWLADRAGARGVRTLKGRTIS